VPNNRAVRSIAHRRWGEPLRLPDEGRLPGFERATGWINSAPLTPASLSGRVVLVDFWTYTCVNWLRTLPYLRAWNSTYAAAGLTIVGVHTPEVGFEADQRNVAEHVRELAVDYPVAIDSDYGVWNEFANRYWPALYLADSQGRLRYHHFGEGEYAMTELAIQQLLAEAGSELVDPALVEVHPAGLEVAADWNTLRSPETYLGYGQSSGFVAEDPDYFDRSHVYLRANRLPLNSWELEGDWTLTRSAAVLDAAGGRIAFAFHARDANLVMSPSADGHPIEYRVTLDGRQPGGSHGTDVDTAGRGLLDRPQTYQLVRRAGEIDDAVVEIEFSQEGAQAYCFTFG
jgi:thiol-disulfide isomerase/thioredoxin